MVPPSSIDAVGVKPEAVTELIAAATSNVGAARSALVVYVNCADATLFRLLEVNLFAPTSTVTVDAVALSVAV